MPSMIPADSKGNLDFDAFEQLVKPHTRSIVCTHASNLTDNLTDLSRVSAVRELSAQ